MAELPSKLFFRIGEVAGLVGVEPHVLRYWEREFRSIRPTKSAKGQRVYSRRDVENLLRVRDLLYRDGFTIAGAKKRLQRGPATDGADGADGGDGADGATVGAELDAGPGAPSRAPPPVSRTEEIASGDGADGAGAGDLRSKLVALRAEVEGFLDELSPESAASSPEG
jgi:DNA-binding transcriptional MerR regulator